MHILKMPKWRNLLFSLLFAFTGITFFSFSYVYSQENSQLAAATKTIFEDQDSAQLYKSFETLQAKYLPEHKYAEFIKLLNSLGEKRKGLEKFIDYYIASTRYQQLKNLEEKQSWDEYFDKGSDYRNELSERVEKAIAATQKSEALNIYAKLILWQFHKDQEDVFAEQAFTDLIDSTLEYAKGAKDMKPVKDAADKLAAYGERLKAKELYRAYVDKLTTSLDIAGLKSAAAAFYKEGNLELSESVYDLYIEKEIKAMPNKEGSNKEVIPLLLNIATSFTFREEGLQDAIYAEKIFKKIEELGGEEIFNEEQIYLRAFNLEKIKDYIPARAKYLYLLKQYPQTTHADEAMFKAAIISTYVMRDIPAGEEYFQQLAKRQKITPQAISAIYQLGLLKQWTGALSAAKEYYKQLLEKAKEGFPETAGLASERMKEIEEARPIEYNLKTFLDASLKEGRPLLDTAKIPLTTVPYRIKKGDNARIASGTEGLETGCLKPDIQYLWSGHLGTARPETSQSAFDTTYPQHGTKEINLVIVSSAGIVDRNIDIADVY